MTDFSAPLMEALRIGDPTYLARRLMASSEPKEMRRAFRRARRMVAAELRRSPRVLLASPTRQREVIEGVICQGCTRGWRRAIREALQRIRSSHRDWNRLRARVLGFEVTALEPGTAGEFQNGFEAPSELHFLAPGVIQLSVQSRPSATVVAQECGHAVTTRAEWEAREREIDGEWASEGCANRYVLKWGFGERALRQTVHAQLGHMGGVPGDVITVSGLEGNRRYRVTRGFRYRPL